MTLFNKAVTTDWRPHLTQGFYCLQQLKKDLVQFTGLAGPSTLMQVTINPMTYFS